ncbi:hypothetical protein [Gilvimarinus polysaccharolyticus]|uniref:hypothetical protein n=1 Tax=Gilvimarinus polysaccharolyticus TaxID=863921 RepID=UPI000673BCCB|nr:hypothetical protein [Gilvimarinus polysaccharolyticus]
MSDLSPIIQQVSYAEQSLLQQRRTDSGGANNAGSTGSSMGVIFTGNFHHSVPNHLIFDGQLSPADKLLWQVLRAFISNPKMPGYVPSREELSAAMVCSAPTVAKSRATLRINRWMTYCRTVRDERQRFVGDVYLLHDEPLSLADTLALDAGYIHFLEAQVSGASAGKANRNLASLMLSQVEALESTPRSPTQLESIEDRIREAAFGEPRFIKTMHDESRVKNFNTAQNAGNVENSHDELPEYGDSGPSGEIQASHDKIFNTGSESHVKNFNMAFDQNLSGKENFLHGSGKNNFFNSRSICSSSININKYITTRVRDEPSENTQINPLPQSEPSELLTDCLGGAHMGWLVSEATQPMLFLWEIYRPNIPVLGRLLLGLPDQARREVVYQLFGRMIFNLKFPGTEPIHNIVSFLRALVERRKADSMMLDEWGQLVKEAVEDGEPHFLIGQGGAK